MRILIVPCPCPLATNIDTALLIFHHLPSRDPFFQNLFRVGLHALGDAQGAYVIARELLGQQGEEAYGAALQGSTLTLDVASQHVAEEAHEHGAEREVCIGAVVNLAGVAYELEAQRVACNAEVKTKEKV